MAARRRATLLRRLSVLSFVAMVAVVGLSVLAFLTPPEAKARSMTAGGLLWQGDQWTSSIILSRQADTWVGALEDFPPGSTAHFRPLGSPNFFLVRATDGTFRALTDRNVRTGQVLMWRDPLPHRQEPGFYDPRCGYMWLADGEPDFAGPKWPLGAFALTVEGSRVLIGTRPSYRWPWGDLVY
jgi:hypothetical protein